MSHDCSHEEAVTPETEPEVLEGSVNDPVEVPAEPTAPQREQMVLRMEPNLVRALRDTFIAVADGKEVIIVEAT